MSAGGRRDDRPGAPNRFEDDDEFVSVALSSPIPPRYDTTTVAGSAGVIAVIVHSDGRRGLPVMVGASSVITGAKVAATPGRSVPERPLGNAALT
jgi:hypothetical protein